MIKALQRGRMSWGEETCQIIADNMHSIRRCDMEVTYDVHGWSHATKRYQQDDPTQS